MFVDLMLLVWLWVLCTVLTSLLCRFACWGGVNFVGGWWLVGILVVLFCSLCWMLINSVEMRADFIHIVLLAERLVWVLFYVVVD